MRTYLALVALVAFVLIGPAVAWTEHNYTYIRSTDINFLHNISNVTCYPNKPLGYCIDGTREVVEALKAKNYNVTYAMYQGTWTEQGHVWCLVENPAHKNTWLAVDNVYGPIAQDYWQYYKPQYSFDTFDQIDKFTLTKKIDPALLR